MATYALAAARPEPIRAIVEGFGSGIDARPVRESELLVAPEPQPRADAWCPCLHPIANADLSATVSATISEQNSMPPVINLFKYMSFSPAYPHSLNVFFHRHPRHLLASTVQFSEKPKLQSLSPSLAKVKSGFYWLLADTQ